MALWVWGGGKGEGGGGIVSRAGAIDALHTQKGKQETVEER